MTDSRRTCGVLLHLTSLPSACGVGDLGPEAVRFGEFLTLSGQRRWQMLPFGPTAASHGSSPYSGFSAFAGNTLWISPERLFEDGLATRVEVEAQKTPPGPKVDFPAVEAAREAFLRGVFDRLAGHAGGRLENDPTFAAFREQNVTWLADFALFIALKSRFGGAAWTEWPEDIRDRTEPALRRYGEELHREILFHQFCQWLFFRQWGRLKWKLGKLDVELVGDVPIYVTHDSADVWANRRLFKLDAAGRQLCVAGVPPDYFSKTGQRWGNPVYDWDASAREGHAWWISRLRHNLGLFDLVRLDHFRGFLAYWEIDAAEKTAIKGCWVPGPGATLFDALRKAHGSLPFIAEDLGVITPDVVELRERLGLPGMRVLQFAFGPHTPTSPDAPHNHERNCVVYTGTHDNNTTRGWFHAEADASLRRVLTRYLGHELTEDTVTREFIRMALASPARHAVIPAQDLLDLGDEARMNVPGRARGNWGWRAPEGALRLEGRGRALAERLRSACELFDRCDPAPAAPAQNEETADVPPSSTDAACPGRG